MYVFVKLGKKKMKTKVLTTFKDRIKGYRFHLQAINEGLCYPKKKSMNTCFLCQRVDIVFTDKDYKILKIYRNVKTEKFFFPKRKAYYIFEFPAYSCSTLQEGEILQVTEKK